MVGERKAYLDRCSARIYGINILLFVIQLRRLVDLDGRDGCF